MANASKQYREVIAPRAATIKAATAYMRGTDPKVVRSLLMGLRIHDKWKSDPQGFADQLDLMAFSEAVGHRFGAWKAAQQVLQAAGLPYMPDDYKDVP